MKVFIQSCVVVVIANLMLACSSTPSEEYVDYFYSNPSDDRGHKVFTYILYLGEKGKPLVQHQKDHMSISTSSSKRASSSKRRSSNLNKGEEYTSLSFRMEEEAFQRLARLLEDKQFCQGEVEYLESEYTWLRYSIKGKCTG
jgi:hypothetical protein